MMQKTTTLQEQTSNVYRLAKKYGITIILKGYNYIICNANERQQQGIAVIRRSTPAMTVGGCGDILSGVVSALLTKTQDTFLPEWAKLHI
jgi:ADP-dependent NAD(P)H-hydrate dehydratase